MLGVIEMLPKAKLFVNFSRYYLDCFIAHLSGIKRKMSLDLKLDS